MSHIKISKNFHNHMNQMKKNDIFFYSPFIKYPVLSTKHMKLSVPKCHEMNTLAFLKK